MVLDCKGAADARRIADRARRALRVAGARSTAVWPDEASLSLWALPPAQLTTTLVDLIEHGTGAAYYADVMEAVVGLAVAAPAGPAAIAMTFTPSPGVTPATGVRSPSLERPAVLPITVPHGQQFGTFGSTNGVPFSGPEVCPLL